MANPGSDPAAEPFQQAALGLDDPGGICGAPPGITEALAGDEPILFPVDQAPVSHEGDGAVEISVETVHSEKKPLIITDGFLPGIGEEGPGGKEPGEVDLEDPLDIFAQGAGPEGGIVDLDPTRAQAGGERLLLQVVGDLDLSNTDDMPGV